MTEFGVLLLSIFSLVYKSDALESLESCGRLPEAVEYEARCRAFCATLNVTTSPQCLDDCQNNNLLPVDNSTAAGVRKPAPWPSISVLFNPLEILISWNSSEYNWRYYILLTTSNDCPAQNRSSFVENSPASQLVLSECAYTVCLIGADEFTTSHSSGPVQITTKTAATQVIVKPYFDSERRPTLQVEWTCPNPISCVFNWTTEYDVEVTLVPSRAQRWCSPAVPTYYRGRIFESSGSNFVTLTDITRIRTDCTYRIQISAVSAYRIAPVLVYTYTIPSEGCLDGYETYCPLDYVRFTTPRPETRGLASVSNLSVVLNGTTPEGWIQAIITWGFPDSPYYYVIESFLIRYSEAIQYPDGLRFTGPTHEYKEIKLSSNASKKSDTFEWQMELVKNKKYMISVSCKTKHNKHCLEKMYETSTFAPTDITTTTTTAITKTTTIMIVSSAVSVQNTNGTVRANGTAENFRTSAGSKLVATVAVPLVVIALVALVFLWCCYSRRYRKKLVRTTSSALAQVVRVGSEKQPHSYAITPAMENPTILIPKDVWELDRQRIILETNVGGGAFGTVSLAMLAPGRVAGNTRIERNFTKAAIKTVKGLSSSSSSAETTTNGEEITFQREIDIMKAIGSHRHVVEMLGCCTLSSPLYLVLEYIPYGNLLELLQRSREQITEPNLTEDSELPTLPLHSGSLQRSQIFNIGRQVAAGMEHVSSLRIVHRDLAARNVLVGKNMTFKVSDFGLSRDVYLDSAYQNTSRGRLPVKWMALESLIYRTFTSQSDVWSYGILLWETVTLGAFPYPALSAQHLPRLLSKGYRMECPPNCSMDIYDTMRSCWLEKPNARPTFAALSKVMEKFIEMEPETFYVALDDVQTDWLPTEDCTADAEIDLETSVSEVDV